MDTTDILNGLDEPRQAKREYCSAAHSSTHSDGGVIVSTCGYRAGKKRPSEAVPLINGTIARRRKRERGQESEPGATG